VFGRVPIFTALLAETRLLAMPAARYFFARDKKVSKKHAKGKGFLQSRPFLKNPLPRRLPTALRYVRLTANIRSVSSSLLSNSDPLRWARRWLGTLHL